MPLVWTLVAHTTLHIHAHLSHCHCQKPHHLSAMTCGCCWACCVPETGCYCCRLTGLQAAAAEGYCCCCLLQMLLLHLKQRSSAMSTHMRGVNLVHHREYTARPSCSTLVRHASLRQFPVDCTMWCRFQVQQKQDRITHHLTQEGCQVLAAAVVPAAVVASTAVYSMLLSLYYGPHRTPVC